MIAPTIRFRSFLAPVMAVVFATAALLWATGSHAADKAAVDVPGSHDHPLIKRFAGSWLIGYRQTDWDQIAVPVGMAVADRKMKDTVTLEGKVTRIVYLSPRGKTPLEIHRNYQQALMAAGFKPAFSCEKDCGDLFYAWHDSLDVVTGFKWAEGSITTSQDNRYSLYGAIKAEQGRFLYGTIPSGGRDVHVLLYDSVAENPNTDMAGTTLIIVEPKAMTTGQVTVDAKALQSGLASDGKIALYGIYFDTGKAELKPESKPQLEQMAKLLREQPALKVYIVGHTDNQGALDANLTLSQQRAQAVTAALVGDYKIDAERLTAKGVASLAPVASNAAEDGRARNRRVELVAQ